MHCFARELVFNHAPRLQTRHPSPQSPTSVVEIRKKHLLSATPAAFFFVPTRGPACGPHKQSLFFFRSALTQVHAAPYDHSSLLLTTSPQSTPPSSLLLPFFAWRSSTAVAPLLLSLWRIYIFLAWCALSVLQTSTTTYYAHIMAARRWTRSAVVGASLVGAAHAAVEVSMPSKGLHVLAGR